MPIPPQFSFTEKLPPILGRINPIILSLTDNQNSIGAVEQRLDDIDADNMPDLVVLFENGLV